MDRNDPDVKLCIQGTAAGFAAAGVITGGFGAPFTAGLSLPVLAAGGAAMGFVVGYIACPRATRAIKERLKTGDPFEDEFVFNEAVDVMRDYSGVATEAEAIKLLAVARQLAPHAHGSQKVCTQPSMAARQILDQMG